MISDAVKKLHQKVLQGDINYVEKALQNGIAVDAVDADDNTLLHVAAANEKYDIAVLLANRRANVEAENSLGWTPLMQAARHGHEELVRMLLDRGAKVGKHNQFGMTALALACVSGHMATLRVLLDAGAECNPVASVGFLTPLAVAAYHGHDAVVRIMLDRGVKAGKPLHDTDLTPLMFSAAGSSLSVTQTLLDRGADPNVSNNLNLTPFDVANFCHHPDIANCLSKKTRRKGKGSKERAEIFSVIKRGNMKHLRDILHHDRSQCQAVSPDGATPLITAVVAGDVDAVRLLLEYGAPVDQPDFKNGFTPLMQAIYNRETEVAKYLIENDANVNLVSPAGLTAFDFASETLDAEIIALLSHSQTVEVESRKFQPMSWQTKQNAETSKGGLKEWWNRVSNKFHKVKQTKSRRSSLPDHELWNERNRPFSPISYDPVVPWADRLTPAMAFKGSSARVTETIRGMVPPHISPLCTKSGHKDMPGGRKLMPGSGKFNVRHCNSLKVLSSDKNSSRHSFGLSGGTLVPPGKFSSRRKSLTKFSSHRRPGRSPDVSHSPRSCSRNRRMGDNASLSKLLKQNSLDKYIPVFKNEDIDMEAFSQLNEADLKELGISASIARSKLLSLISHVND